VTAAAALPHPIVEAIERAIDGRIADVRRHAGGGNSREGGYVDLETPAGPVAAYLAYDVRRTGDDRPDFLRREAAAIRIAHDAGIKAPRVIGSFPDLRAILLGRVDGGAKFADTDERDRAAADYMAELARLHRIDAHTVSNTDLGRATTPADYARRELTTLRARHLAGRKPDPQIALILRWLESNLPPADVAPTLVHGDAGPGNFLHEGGRVTALLDWEMAHFGDPMEDLGWIAIRNTILPFTPMKTLLAAYAAAGGPSVDLARLRYWRLFAHAAMLVDQHATLWQIDTPFGGTLGNVLMYHLLHRKLSATALAELIGMPQPAVAIPDVAEPITGRFHDMILDDIRLNMIPRAADIVVDTKLKATARIVKYWKQRERLAPVLDPIRRDAIAAVLGLTFATVDEAETALAGRIVDGAIDDARAYPLVALQAAQHLAIGADLMGGLARRDYDPLD
jgi:aminoglycoside phosphotransferase (APT) family kinase protein